MNLKEMKIKKEKRRTPTLHTNGKENLAIALRIPVSDPLQGFL